MDFKPKNREWVKNAAIIFLAVLLVLTFFSNTWMNRSLPEVATQSVTDGSIVAKVRGTGTVTAVGSHQVKAERTRDIRAVMVKAGQEVETGDVLFILGEGEASEIEAAEEALRALQVSYQRAAAGVPTYDYRQQELEIKAAKSEWQEAEKDYAAAIEKNNKSGKSLPVEQLSAAEQELEQAQTAVDAAKIEVAKCQVDVDTAQKIYDEKLAKSSEEIGKAKDNYDQATSEKDAAEQTYKDTDFNYHYERDHLPPEEWTTTDEMLDKAYTAYIAAKNAAADAEAAWEKAKQDYPTPSTADLTAKQAAFDDAESKLNTANDTLTAAQNKVDAIKAVIEEILGKDVVSDEVKKAKAARDAAEKTYYSLVYSLEQQQAQDAKSQAMSYVDLQDLAGQIERAREKLNSLSGGEENQITAKVSGTVTSISCTAGDTKLKDDVLCTIEVPDMGHTVSFSVTNEQARRLRQGDEATVSNYYWGNRITATLSSIQVDPKNPQTNKLLTFDVEGDVNSGAELTLSVGQKSANYDVIIPNSAIRSDSNGSFVLAVEARNSPLGNRYVARRVNVEVLASDDNNAAVTADLGWGDYVITTSSAPIKNGDLVRLADS